MKASGPIAKNMPIQVEILDRPSSPKYWASAKPDMHITIRKPLIGLILPASSEQK